ncbi:LysR family transcriptional regulator [Zhengella mangrovi]|uniref:LysR family transcriptional regulator n=1 Tax=Zhengella mangrovi TaxID=1982044 RepID=A0A2G1QKD3_9HYPH|nr:LysR family transcriptional regulator [Zhengella mangrovi]PHP65910.1 LysR family transcriptional regulator [Zhengella mangrovi]
MHISRVDLNLLVVFDAIYTQSGVTKAAETLNLTQPTISHALARLRDHVGDPLFVRQGQKLVPTPAAHKMISPVRRALQTIETTLADLEGFEPATARMTFKLGIHPLTENLLFSPLAERLQQTAPGIGLSSVLLDRRNIEADLAAGIFNVAVDIFLPLPETIMRRRMSGGRSVVVVRQDHPLAHRGMTLDDYLAQRHIIVSTRRQGLGPEDIALSRLGKSRTIALRCQQLGTAMDVVSRSDLVLTMSETFARRSNRLHGNSFLPLPFDVQEIEFYLYWHRNSDSDQANRWLRDQLVSAITEVPEG